VMRDYGEGWCSLRVFAKLRTPVSYLTGFSLFVVLV
jgi:hypothetical protein